MGRYLKQIEDIVKEIHNPIKIDIISKITEFDYDTLIKDFQSNQYQRLAFIYYINTDDDIDFYNKLEGVLYYKLKNTFSLKVTTHNSHKKFEKDDIIYVYVRWETKED